MIKKIRFFGLITLIVFVSLSVIRIDFKYSSEKQILPFFNSIFAEGGNKIPFAYNQSFDNKTTLLFNTSGVESLAQNADTDGNVDRKLILFWTPWGEGGKWSDRFGSYSNLKEQRCPSWSCEFTSDRNRINEADAVIFSRFTGRFEEIAKFMNMNLNQRWVFVDVEAYTTSSHQETLKRINWTMTYHSAADITAPYGQFISKKDETMPLRPNIMDYSSDTMKEYLKSLARGDTLHKVYGPRWRNFVGRPKLAAWMSSHCPTKSKREVYISKIEKLIQVDTYGSCGKQLCQKRSPYNSWCWENILAPNYLFHFSMENTLCDEYITEKLYNPMKYGLVPVVYGGANYSRFLPPHSYIDALKYSFEDLAKLLTELQNDPFEYGRYHLWRHYWDVKTGGSLCELCHKLHTDKEKKSYVDFNEWRRSIEDCSMKPNVS